MGKLAIVTASTDLRQAKGCIDSWFAHAYDSALIELVVIENGPKTPGGYLGTVPAFRLGVDQALDRAGVEIIACLHDDLQIDGRGWDQAVRKHFDRQPACGLAGFGGAIGLGSDDLYQVPYEPMQLARHGFRSNLSNAEAHGVRSLLPERVACLDGFSQIGRRAFWEGLRYDRGEVTDFNAGGPPWAVLQALGIVHHFYDGLLGCLAARAGWETWYLPIAATHYGGRTAVGDPGYQDWATTQVEGGDHGFWEQAHKAGYEAFRDVLPLRV